MIDPDPLAEAELRELVPAVIGILVSRGADFATAEDAVQDALIEALRSWPSDPPRDRRGWLVTVAWRKFLDIVRSEGSRMKREERVMAATLAEPETSAEPGTDGVPKADDTLYLVFNEGHSGDVDLVAEAIRLTRSLRAMIDSAEVDGLLALMLLNHARRDARFGPDGRLIALADQDRILWNRRLIVEGIEILQAALGRDELGQYQAQAAIAALHADAQTVEDTDWVQIVQWYDELLALRDTPIVRLNRAVAVGEADGPAAGLAELQGLDKSLPRYFAVEAHLRERTGESQRAAELYVRAAERAGSLAERAHLNRQAARVRSWQGHRP
ncbi:Sigma-70 region 2 [Brevibacterium siliguriense]|uniref:Sigma-70 region 2 n=1 Tax=Brevibacterium siliguriense TaxID=1136497 RepID=A0A1H1XBC5_9MICO|nr:DUF6596 domain-containing protein [Brevibacterium siliguriense]SDT06410.1 Sigma-70 region 2 [Brevibacterium siliguriense]